MNRDGYIAIGTLGLATLVGLASRNPNVIVSVAVIAVIMLLVLGGTSLARHRRERAWTRAVQQARWRPTERDVHGRTEIVIERVAESGDRSEKLGEQHIEWLDAAGAPEGVWDAAFAEAWGRAENRALVRNARIP